MAQWDALETPEFRPSRAMFELIPKPPGISTRRALDLLLPASL